MTQEIVFLDKMNIILFNENIIKKTQFFVNHFKNLDDKDCNA